MSSVVKSSVNFLLFADDLKLYSALDLSESFKSTDLQNVLDDIYEWSCLWQLTINTDKCTSLRLNSRPNNVTAPCYVVNGMPLSHVSNTRDLGVIVDSRLFYNNHIESICSKSMQRCGIFFRAFTCRNLPFLRKAFITYTRLLLEYSTIIWNPVLKKHIDSLEKIQRNFTKHIPSLKTLPYLERLRSLKLETL